MAEEGPLYLGFDLSTQQLKAIVIQSDLTVVSEVKVGFDEDFGPKYGINNGVLVDDAENEVVAPVALFLEAIDLVLTRLKATTTPMHRIKGISGSCQQHGSTYWGRDADALLASLDPSPSKGGLVDQLPPAFSHPYAPNWQDGSTQAQCDRFDAHLGSPQNLAEVTGSAAHHRFTGTQIMRLREREPAMYAATGRISLVSSFLASVLLGKTAPIDISDVCGMNLWDMNANAWSEPLLELTAGGDGSGKAAADLRAKLGDPRPDGGGSMGSVCEYFRGRYGFSPDCQVAPFTGDNPATILSLPLRPLDAIVSLGTSSTFLMITPVYKPDASYHFMNHPCNPGQYMFMLCYKNGGLARERVRDALVEGRKNKEGVNGANGHANNNDKVSNGHTNGKAASNPWEKFNQRINNTAPLDISDYPVDPSATSSSEKAKLGLYFDLPEIVPNVRAGTWRYTVSPSGDLSTLAEEREPWGAQKDPRVIVESQTLSMRLRSQNLVQPPAKYDGTTNGTASNANANANVPDTSSISSRPALPAQPRRIYLVGGGSLNPAIARVIGEVLGGVDGVYRLDVGGNACALGGAYKALWALERDGGSGDGKAKQESFDELIGKRWREEEAIEKVDVGYREGVFERYGRVVPAFEEMERRVLEVAKN